MSTFICNLHRYTYDITISLRHLRHPFTVNSSGWPFQDGDWHMCRSCILLLICLWVIPPWHFALVNIFITEDTMYCIVMHFWINDYIQTNKTNTASLTDKSYNSIIYQGEVYDGVTGVELMTADIWWDSIRGMSYLDLDEIWQDRLLIFELLITVRALDAKNLCPNSLLSDETTGAFLVFWFSIQLKMSIWGDCNGHAISTVLSAFTSKTQKPVIFMCRCGTLQTKTHNVDRRG